MKEDATLEKVERVVNCLKAFGERAHPLSKKIKGRAVSAHLCCMGGNLAGAREELKFGLVHLSELLVALEEAASTGDLVVARDMPRRAQAAVGRLTSPAQIERQEARQLDQEVIPLKATELFKETARGEVATRKILGELASKGVNSSFLAEYIADYMKKTKENGSITQKREALKLFFSVMHHTEPRSLFELSEDDLEALSDEELAAYQSLCAKLVAQEMNDVSEE